MRIGGLRKRFTLQSEGLVADGSGGQAANWTDVTAVWGEVEPVGGSASVGGAFDKRITHAITLRYRPDVVTGMRLALGERAFLVRSVVNDGEENRALVLMVEEGGLLGS